MTVEPLQLNNQEECRSWDEFCIMQNHRPALFHSSGWARAVVDAYSVECKSFAEIGQNGKIKTVFSVFECRNMRLKKRFVSIPHAPYGGFLNDEMQDESDHQVLLELFAGSLCNMSEKRILTRSVAPEAIDEGKLESGERVTMWLELPNDVDTLWKSFPAKVRNQVRKAEREGVTVSAGTTNREFNDFYKLYSKRMHELGTPPHSRRFFKLLMNEFSDSAEFTVAYHENKPIAAIFDIGFGVWRVNLYGASDFARRSLCANNLVYWQALRNGVERGAKWFDFGRSEYGQGQYRFKKQWGAQPRRVAEFWLVKTEEGADGQWQEHESGGYNRGLADIWRRTPRFCADIAGPFLRRFVV